MLYYQISIFLYFLYFSKHSGIVLELDQQMPQKVLIVKEIVQKTFWKERKGRPVKTKCLTVKTIFQFSWVQSSEIIIKL